MTRPPADSAIGSADSTSVAMSGGATLTGNPQPETGARPIRVAFDVTPLIGARTGVGNLVAGFHSALNGFDDVELVGYAATVRGRREITRLLGARVAPLPARLLRKAWMTADWPKVEQWCGQVDLVHGMNYVVPPTRAARSIVSVHDLTVVRFPELCTADTLQYPQLLRRAFLRGAHVHVDSSFVRAELLEWSGIGAERIHIISPGLSLMPVVDPSRLGGRVASVLTGRPFILGIGTVEPRKDYATLVRAFGAVASAEPDLTLVIAGSDGWGANRLQATLDRLPAALRERVVRLGFVDDNEKWALLAGARVLAYPSIYEGFGLPPLEAMQAGTPVVATVAGSLPEVLGDAAEYVEVSDDARLSQSLLRVLTDENRRGELIGRGLVRAASYTWARAAKEMRTLYRELAGVDRR